MSFYLQMVQAKASAHSESSVIHLLRIGLISLLALLVTPLTHAQYVEVSLPPISCSGFVAKLGPSAAQAYLLTAGHCLPGLFDREHPAKILSRVAFDEPKKMVVYALGSKPPAVISATGIDFASAQGADLAVLTLAESVTELERMGVAPLTAQLSFESLQSRVEVLSATVGERAECALEAKPWRLSFQSWIWSATGRLSADCRLWRGWSGAPFVSVESGRVIGLVSGGNDDGTCDDYCEADQAGHKAALQGRAYFSALSILAACVSERGQLVPELCEFER